MCDMFLEMIKSMSISEKELKRRFTYTNLDFLRRLEEQNKSIIFMCGHYASYEWLISLQLHGLKFRSFGIYKKIRNHYFDQLIRDIRGKFDAKLISMYEATETIQRNETEGLPGNYAMIADQSPKLQRAKYWFHFMGVRVPVFEGSERLAKKLDMNVIYLHVEKKNGDFTKLLLNRSAKTLRPSHLIKSPELFRPSGKPDQEKSRILFMDAQALETQRFATSRAC